MKLEGSLNNTVKSKDSALKNTKTVFITLVSWSILKDLKHTKLSNNLISILFLVQT